MASKREENGGKGFDFFGSLLSRGLDLLGAGSQLLAQVRDKAERRVEALAMRMGLRLLLQLWISAGILIALSGLMDLLVEYAGVSPGLVHALGGALIASVSLLLLHFARKGMEGAAHKD